MIVVLNGNECLKVLESSSRAGGCGFDFSALCTVCTVLLKRS